MHDAGPISVSHHGLHHAHGTALVVPARAQRQLLAYDEAIAVTR